MTQFKTSETEIRQSQIARAEASLAGARERLEETNRQIAAMHTGLRVAQVQLNAIDAEETKLKQFLNG